MRNTDIVDKEPVKGYSLYVVIISMCVVLHRAGMRHSYAGCRSGRSLFLNRYACPSRKWHAYRHRMRCLNSCLHMWVVRSLFEWHVSAGKALHACMYPHCGLLICSNCLARYEAAAVSASADRR